MRLNDLEVFITRNKTPGKGGQYFIFVKLSTSCGIVGYGEVYSASIHPQAMKSVIIDVFERHMLEENPQHIEIMFNLNKMNFSLIIKKKRLSQKEKWVILQH